MALHCGILSRVRAMLLEVKFVQLKYSYGGDLVEHKVLGLRESQYIAIVLRFKLYMQRWLLSKLN